MATSRNGNAVDSAKRMVDLEAQLYRLTREKMKLTEEVVEVKDKEQNTKEMHAKVKAKYVNLKETFKSEESKWKEEKKEFEAKLCEAELDKKKLEIELKFAAARIEDGPGSDDVAQRLKAVEAEAGSLKSLLEEKDATITRLLGKNGVLDKDKGEKDAQVRELESRLVIENQATRAREAKLHVVEEKISELVQRVQVLVNDNGEKDAQILKLGSRFEIEYEANRAREADYQKAVQKIEILEKDNGEKDAEIRRLGSILEMSYEANRDREAKNHKMERILELLKTIQVLEKDKWESNEAEKKRTGEARKNISELTYRVAALEAVKEAAESEKRDMNDEHTRKVLELNKSIEVLRREKGEIEAKLCQADRDKRGEIERILDEKRAEEDEHKKKVFELTHSIGVLEKEKAERDHEMNKMKSRFQMDYRAKKTREAENRKVEEKITELVGKIEVLEKEKEKREAEIRTGTERIEAEKKRISEKVKALESEKRKADSVLEREKRKMESDFKANRDRKILEIISSVEDLGKGIEAKDCQAGRELIEKEILGTPPTPQNQGEGSCVEKWSGTKKRKSGGRPKWESAFEMLNAVTTNDELCMRSVCALNRKHKSLGSWKNCSSSDNTAAFKPIHESMGMALGELLTNGDPEGKMKKSLPKFKRAHPLDLEECRLIAKHHHMELFQIYKNNLDPFFMSADC